MLEILRQRATARPIISTSAALLDYLRASMADLPAELLRVLYLDGRNGLIADEVLGLGTIDQAPAYPREIMRLALEHGACALILVHNHPSGDPTPSKRDIQVTRNIAEAGRWLDMKVHDHLVVGRDGWTSFRSMGLL